MESVQVNYDLLPRSYLFHQPAEVLNSRPLVVLLHGTGGNASFALNETHLLEFAETAGFVVACPDALPLHPDKAPAFLSNPRRWNDGSLVVEHSNHHKVDDVGFLAHLVLDVVQRTGVDPRHVFLTGFSNGAAMTFRMVVECPRVFAAIAPVAGYLPPLTSSCQYPVSTLYLLGDADPLIPWNGGEVKSPWAKMPKVRAPVAQMLAEWANQIGCSPEPHLAFEDAHCIEEIYPHTGPQVEFRSVRIRGLGHHWPGGKGQLNPRIGGPPGTDFNANHRIWEFFKHRSLV